MPTSEHLASASARVGLLYVPSLEYKGPSGAAVVGSDSSQTKVNVFLERKEMGVCESAFRKRERFS
jgi:hypothetical protein